jgi:mono/diheme cytochrome c family protein
MTLRPARLLLWLTFSLSPVACDRAPAAESLPQWSPVDHHSSDDDKLQSGAQAQGVRPKTGDVAQLVDIAWRQQCTTCHGPLGRGDGQMGPMVQAPDLTQAEWQSKVTDAEMAATIKSGRNRMPRFDLPDPVLAGLVARIRSLRAR